MRRLFLLLTLLAAPLRAEPLIDSDCYANAYDSCFVLIEGEITPGTTERLRALADSGAIEGGTIYLNSPGGSLGEGLRLGRYIREMNWETAIGGSEGVPRNDDGTPRFMGFVAPTTGRCESACAYAFMGGARRFYRDSDRLGLHQFYAPGQQIGGEVAQRFSGEVVAYMVEMGVDARIFTLASAQESSGMYYVPRAQAESYDLVTRFGFDDLFMEPYKAGMVAASRRLDPPTPYDGVDQISFYCRGSQPYVLMHAAIHYFPDGATTGTLAFPEIWLDGEETKLLQDSLSVRTEGDSAYILLRLPPETAQAMSQAARVSIHTNYGRALGGNYRASRDTSALDREMLAAAFRLCID